MPPLRQEKINANRYRFEEYKDNMNTLFFNCYCFDQANENKGTILFSYDTVLFPTLNF